MLNIIQAGDDHYSMGELVGYYSSNDSSGVLSEPLNIVMSLHYKYQDNILRRSELKLFITHLQAVATTDLFAALKQHLIDCIKSRAKRSLTIQDYYFFPNIDEPSITLNTQSYR